MFIVLIVLFVVIIICCIIEVYRTDRQHKKRIERETDESIIWSKEQAAKIHESPGSRKFSHKSEYKPVSFEDLDVKGNKPGEPLIGILKNGSVSKQMIESERPPKDVNGGIRGE